MTNHKFTDEEIVKALECCGSSEERVTHCKGCPLYEYGSSMCIQTVMCAALDLINRQKAEIERLHKHNTEMARKHYNDGIKAFAERLKTELTKGSAVMRVSTLDVIDDLVKEMTEE